jgi:hypothetical protein
MLFMRTLNNSRSGLSLFHKTSRNQTPQANVVHFGACRNWRSCSFSSALCNSIRSPCKVKPWSAARCSRQFPLGRPRFLRSWHGSSNRRLIAGPNDFLVFDCLDHRYSDRSGLVLRAIDPAALVIPRIFPPGLSDFRVDRAPDLGSRGARSLRRTSTCAGDQRLDPPRGSIPRYRRGVACDARE